MVKALSLNNAYAEIPPAEHEDVSAVDDPIDKKAKKTIKYAAVACGCCLVTALVTLVSVRLSIGIMMPPITLYQTSQGGLGGSGEGDRLTSMDPSSLRKQGFDVGLLAFGNTECSKLLSVINAGNGLIAGEKFGVCSPPAAVDASRIDVDADIKYQKILGFGGAFTEAAAVNFFKLPPSVQKKVVDLYWGPDGIGYTLGRVPINSCDFSVSSYSFDEIEGDYELEYFDTEVTHDNSALMPLIRLAMDASPLPIKLLASPWSPPKWMKVPVNGYQNMTGSAQPSGLLDDARVKRAWALYISKWISAYESKGIPVWAITPQNEPEFPAPWEACAFNASYAREWIDGYLGPAMRANHPSKLILAFDHNKDHLLHWSEEMLGGMQQAASEGSLRAVANPAQSSQAAREPSQYVDGMAFHWYTGDNDRVLDGTYGYNNVNATYHLAPEKVLLASEGCSCPDVKLDNWLRAERLAHDIIFDFQAYTQGWIDWNLLVDYEGGPNHLGNMCDAPLVCTPDFSNVHVQPKFQFMGHFSKFVPPGSVRIASTVVGNYKFADGLDPNIRAGVEIGAFACEKSSRQVWKFNSNKGLELKVLAQDSEAKDGYMARLCVSGGDANRPYLHAVICEKGQYPALKITRIASSGLWIDENSGKCLSLAGGVSEPGALLELTTCASSHLIKDNQQFLLESTGEVIINSSKGPLCLTAGWPFLTGVAFQDPRGKTAVVVMNEADASTRIIIGDKDKGQAWLGMPPKSIQTLLY